MTTTNSGKTRHTVYRRPTGNLACDVCEQTWTAAKRCASGKPADFMDVLVDGKKVRHWKEGRNVLEDLLAKGVEVVPLCSPEECPDFHDKDGCPGHIMDKVEGVASVIA